MKTVKELPNGQFDVQDGHGNSLSFKFGGTFYKYDTAFEAARMLNSFDAVDERIKQISDSLRAVSSSFAQSTITTRWLRP